MTESDNADEVTAAGSDAMTQARLILNAEIKTGTRMRFAREALTQVEETLKFRPDAVFRYEGSELFLHAAADHLRNTIKRAEEIYNV